MKYTKAHDKIQLLFVHQKDYHLVDATADKFSWQLPGDVYTEQRDKHH